MEKLSAIGHFTKILELLRNTECSTKEKLNYFHQLSDLMVTPQMMSHVNYSKHCSSAIAILLFFCEDLESLVRMNAEENLNKIIRSMETTRSNRILYDLFNEIKKNGNQKSLKICLNLFAYYCPRIKDKNIKLYAMKLLPCLQMIAVRKETLLIESLTEFIKMYGQHLQNALNDNETLKLLDVFLNSIVSDCAVKRRCSAQCCIVLMENCKHKNVMAKTCINRALEFLKYDHQQPTINILGVLGYFRLLLPVIIAEHLCEPKQIIDIYDFCLYLLNNQNHSIINAALEVINSILNRLSETKSEVRYNKTYGGFVSECDIEEFLTVNPLTNRMRFNEIFKKRKSLKNQIFQLRNLFEQNASSGGSTLNSIEFLCSDDLKNHEEDKKAICIEKENVKNISTLTPSSKTAELEISKCEENTKIERDVNAMILQNNGDGRLVTGENIENKNSAEQLDVRKEELIIIDADDCSKENPEDITVLLDVNDSIDDDDDDVTSEIIDDSFRLDAVNDSFDFESEIAIGVQNENTTQATWKQQKSTDSIGMFFNSFLSQSNAESMTKLFRPSTKSSQALKVDQEQQPDTSATLTAPTTPKSKQIISNLVEKEKLTSATATTTAIPTTPLPTILNFNAEDDTISLESINSHISFGSHVSNQSNSITQDLLLHMRTEKDLQMIVGNVTEKHHVDGDDDGCAISDTIEENFVITQAIDNENFEKDVLRKNSLQKVFDDDNKIYSHPVSDKFDIGTFSDQPIIYYTARLIVTKYLLTGKACDWNSNTAENALISDSLVRVSIKNLALLVLANCIKIMPEILFLSIYIDKTRVPKVPSNDVNLYEEKSCSSSSSCSSIKESKSFNAKKNIILCSKKSMKNFEIVTSHPLKSNDDVEDDKNLLLEIKDDHFGENSTRYADDNTDKSFLSQLKTEKSMQPKSKNLSNLNSITMKLERTQYELNKTTEAKSELTKFLSKSEIIETKAKIASTGYDQISKISNEMKQSKLVDKAQQDTSTKPTPMPRTKKSNISIESNLQNLNSYSNIDENFQKQQIFCQNDDIQKTSGDFDDKKQYIHDVLLYYNHSDPILRGDIQIVIGNFIYGILLMSTNDYYNKFIENFMKNHKERLHPLNMNRLFAILIKGFRDDIHTVMIHAMTTFDKIFPVIMLKYFPMMNYKINDDDDDDADSQQQHDQQRLEANRTDILYTDNDVDNKDFLETLLMLKCVTNKQDQKQQQELAAGDITTKTTTTTTDFCRNFKLSRQISPKFLLNEFQLCYHNKYWLVQNKYSDVISNLKYDAIREFYSDDIVDSYEKQFLDDIIQLLGDEDVRIREHTVKRLCNIIRGKSLSCCCCCYHCDYHQQQDNFDDISILKRKCDTNQHHLNHDYYCTNFNLLREYMEYHVFDSMAQPLKNILNSNVLPCYEIEKYLSQILYILTNKLMEINDKNKQFGIISAVKIMLNHFNPVDYLDAWNEFNLAAVCIQYTQQNFIMATDLNCQNDLIEITIKILSANILIGNNSNKQMKIDIFFHVLKILNIYYHILNNQKPVLFVKSQQKSDIFSISSSKEISIVTNLYGYFGNDFLYIQLYNILKTAFDSYKITINDESGNKLMTLLKTCLNSLAASLEIMENSITITTPPISTTQSPSLLTSSIGGNLQFPNSSQQTIKLIEEILQYLNIFINYNPIETINCLRQLLKFLFGRNFISRKLQYGKFVKFYFMARNLIKQKHQQYDKRRNGGNNNEVDDDEQNFFVDEMSIMMCLEQNISNSPEVEITKDHHHGHQEQQQQPQQQQQQQENEQNIRKNNEIKFITDNKTKNNNAITTTTNTKNIIVCNENRKYKMNEKNIGNVKAQNGIVATIFEELFNSCMNFPLGKSKIEEECARHIKLFEPLVIYCLSLLMKSNAKVQGPILDLLSLLMELNVTYSILDSKNVIFDQVLKNLELIEGGIAKNSNTTILSTIRFLVNLANKNEKKLITMPKIISIINGLLTNYNVIDCSVLALKVLVYEIFFVANCRIKNNDFMMLSSTNLKEFATQKEVILGILDKFIDSPKCLKLLGILMLRNNAQHQEKLRIADGLTTATPRKRECGSLSSNDNIIDEFMSTEYHESIVIGSSPSSSPSPSPSDLTSIQCDSVFAIVVKGLVDRKISIKNFEQFFVLDSLFRNCDKNVLLDSKGFSSLLSLFITKSVMSFSDLSIEMIILDNVILQTEEFFLVNHIKLYLKNQETHEIMYETPRTATIATTSATNEIKYFAQVLYKKLDECISTLKCTPPHRWQQQQQLQQQRNDKTKNNICNLKNYSKVIVKFIKSLYQNLLKNETLSLAFHLELIENKFWEQYFNFEDSLEKISYITMKHEMLKMFCRLELNTTKPNKMLLFEKLVQIDKDYKKNFSAKGTSIAFELQRILVKEIIMKFNESSLWNQAEIEIFLSEFFWIALKDFGVFLEELCEVDDFKKIFIKNVFKHFDLNDGEIAKDQLEIVLRFINNSLNISFENKIDLMLDFCKKYCIKNYQVNNKKLIENEIVQTIKNMMKSEGNDNERMVIKNFMKMKENLWMMDLCSEYEYKGIRKNNSWQFEQKIIDENWLIEQIVEYSTTLKSDEYVKILLDIKSETKLKQIFQHKGFDVKNVLKSCIDISLKSMLQSFQNDCVQFNAHINYMNMNPLVRVSINYLKDLLDNLEITEITESRNVAVDYNQEITYLTISVIALIENLKEIENISLIFIEYKFIEKFLKDQIFKSETIVDTLIHFIIIASRRLINIFKLTIKNNEIKNRENYHMKMEEYTLLKCLNLLFNEKFIWIELNTIEKYEKNLDEILEFIYYGILNSLNCTHFLKKYQLKMSDDKMNSNDDGDDKQQKERKMIIEKAIFISKLIEVNFCLGNSSSLSTSLKESSLELLKSIGISLLRMNKFYAYAVTPFEIFDSNSIESENTSNSSKLPSIPVEHLSDADILQKFMKRLSIFGFTTRQQFEEYFMTFLLLINTDYDENMVDVHEQFQIKCTCFKAILELLITYKTFPSVGNKLTRFHHTVRLPKIKCDTISLKKLHKIQLLLPGSNIYYQSNLERNLSSKIFHNNNDNIIGTIYFLPNQYDLNFIWRIMENSSSLSSSSSSWRGVKTNELDAITPSDAINKEDVQMKNFRYFRQISEIDFKSSSQLIFDVLTQFIDQNHVLVLPILVKFCELCENRDQVKWIKQKALKLQESVPVDDTISHQYVIYLLCKAQSMLIPSTSDLTHLCILISTYLKSSNVFIRNATLHGLLCLLECCSKTNTTIGKLSEELSMLRVLIVGYITRHGIIEESSIEFSDLHTKLVWTLNFTLIEMTMKFVPDCNLLSNTIISANNLLKRTSNENLYLCVLHGLERLVVINVASPTMRYKIEKLSLELLKLENERFSIPALKLLLSCMYMDSAEQLENTELSNGIVQDDPEIVAQQTDKLDILLHCIKSSTKKLAEIYGQVLCQIIRDLVPPKEILTKVIKEFLAVNQPHCDVIARIVHQVFRSAIDSSFLQMLQEWLICTLPTFINLSDKKKSIWCLTVIFFSASINVHLIKLFPIVLNNFNENKNDDKNWIENNRNGDDSKISREILLFVTSARDFHSKLSQEQKIRFRETFVQDKKQQQQQHCEVFQLMLRSL